MTYREKLELYKQGKLPEPEREQVKHDIDRHEAIGEYLLDEIELPGLDPASPLPGSEEQQEDAQRLTSQINASIRKAFVKCGVIVGAAVLAIVLFSTLALPRIVDCFYYDPAKSVGEPDENGYRSNRLSLELGVYSELCLPAAYREVAQVERRGFGRYDLILPNNYGGGTVVGSLERNRLTYYVPDSLLMPAANVFYPELADTECRAWELWKPSMREARLMLNELPEGQNYVAYCTLDGVMSYSELIEWMTRHQVDVRWAALCYKVPAEQAEYYRGASYCMCGIARHVGMMVRSSCSEQTFDAEKYPLLTAFSLNRTAEENWIPSAEAAKRHVASMFRYVDDNPDFFNWNGLITDEHWYQNMARRVEEDGLLFYGFVTVGIKEELLRIADVEHIAYIYASENQ